MDIEVRHELTQFCSLMEETRKKGRVLVCYLDAFGYFLYQEAKKREKIPFISSNFLIEPVKTVEPPVTNPSMATMITGVLPDVHGVHSRKDRRLAVPTIFSKDLGKTAFIEGDSIILNTEIRPSLHPANEAGDSDAQVFLATKEAILQGNEFIFSHFHGIDDCAHDFGPYAEVTLSKVEQIDEYLKEFSWIFKGKMLLVSDHGIHARGNEGEHGVVIADKECFENSKFCIEDMLALWGVQKTDGK